MSRCDNCGCRIDGQRPYTVRIGHGLAYVCGDCLGKIVRGIVTVERAVRQRQAA